MFLVFGKWPFLLRWKNVLSVHHLLHLRFSRNKSVTRTVISVNRPFSGNISSIYAVIAWLLCPTYRPREPRAAEEINFVTG